MYSKLEQKTTQPSYIQITGCYQCWVGIRNRHRPPAVIRAVLKIHHHFVQKIKDMVLVYNRGSQSLLKKNSNNQPEKYMLFLTSSMKIARFFSGFQNR